MADLDNAIAHLEQGNWQAAHELVQDGSSELAYWAHAIVHLMEGDASNAGYWYQRAGRSIPADPDAAREIQALKDAL